MDLAPRLRRNLGGDPGGRSPSATLPHPNMLFVRSFRGCRSSLFSCRAVMEGFFSHLKEEWFRIQKPETLEEFHAGLTDYLRWWNTTRIQQ